MNDECLLEEFFLLNNIIYLWIFIKVQIFYAQNLRRKYTLENDHTCCLFGLPSVPKYFLFKNKKL